MIEERKKICREMIEKQHWNKFGIVEEEPSPLLWNKEVEIMYEDMDGYPHICKAKYVVNCCERRFIALDGPAKGNTMCRLIAYKEIE
jgi:hypothetical protein